MVYIYIYGNILVVLAESEELIEHTGGGRGGELGNRPTEFENVVSL